MIPIIQDLLDAEEQAEQIIAAAREQVQREQIAWEGEEQSRFQTTSRAVEDRVQAELTQARDRAKARHTQAIRQSSEMSEEYGSHNKDAIDQATEEVIAEICRPEVETG